MRSEPCLLERTSTLARQSGPLTARPRPSAAAVAPRYSPRVPRVSKPSHFHFFRVSATRARLLGVRGVTIAGWRAGACAPLPTIRSPKAGGGAVTDPRERQPAAAQLAGQ